MDNKQIIDDFKKRFQLPDKTFIDHSYPPHEEGEMDKWFGTLLQKAREEERQKILDMVKAEHSVSWGESAVAQEIIIKRIEDLDHSELDQDVSK